MIIQIKDTDIQYLKTLCKCFNNFTAYVHEEVYITVGYKGGAEDHEACEALNEFRDQCIFPEFFEMLNDIQDQLKDTVPDPRNLNVILDRAINDWFYIRQRELNITEGAEPLDSDIGTLEERLVNECERVLEWQKKSNTKDPKHDMITQWDMILERDCMCNSQEDYVSLHDGIRDLVDNFYAQIGEAMGPVSYAGFQLTQVLKNKGLSTDWVSNCIQYYQDNWDF